MYKIWRKGIFWFLLKIFSKLKKFSLKRKICPPIHPPGYAPANNWQSFTLIHWKKRSIFKSKSPSDQNFHFIISSTKSPNEWHLSGFLNRHVTKGTKSFMSHSNVKHYKSFMKITEKIFFFSFRKMKHPFFISQKARKKYIYSNK